MFNKIRMRMTYANVLMTLALVFAMTGGAYAAKKYLITSTKQISPSVLKALAGKPGPAGPQGSPGAAGAQGLKGDTGAEGKQGIQGLEGKEGKVGATGATGPAGAKGATGATGPTGTTGSPWTAGGTLPSGKTETGSWELTIGSNIEKVGYASLSLPFPLATSITKTTVVPAGKTGGAGCTGGTAAKPKADAGNFCVYVQEFALGGTVTIFGVKDAGTGAGGEVSAGSGGAVLVAEGPTGEIGNGTFAVTEE